jgi:2-keto-3-deoxy-L-rhamnonate aldolase RhmA
VVQPAGGFAAELLAGSGFDWLLLDTEPSPGDPLTVLEQLQTVAPYDVSPIVRPASNDTVLINRFLDMGAQTLPTAVASDLGVLTRGTESSPHSSRRPDRPAAAIHS